MIPRQQTAMATTCPICQQLSCHVWRVAITRKFNTPSESAEMAQAFHGKYCRRCEAWTADDAWRCWLCEERRLGLRDVR